VSGTLAVLQVLFLLGGPVVLAALLQGRTRARWGVFGWGALVFVLSQVVHVPLLLLIPKGLPLGAQCLVLGGLAGLCEETARYLMFRALAKEGRGLGNALMGGLGHGGIECMIIGALVAVSLVSAQSVAVSGAPAEAAQAALVLAAPPSDRLAAMLERVSAVTCHVSFAVLAERAVRHRSIVPALLAFALHAGLDASAVYLAQTKGVWAAEAGALGFAVSGAIVIAIAARAEPALRPEPLAALADVPADRAIVTRSLGRSFGERHAVRGVDLEVRRGEVLALLGPNGAGKTTTVRMLAALLAPSEGGARIAGVTLGEDDEKLRTRIGVAPESPGLWERLTCGQNLSIFGELYGLSPAQIAERSAQLLGRLGIADRANDKVSTFSKGMKQKTALARALLHTPEIVFLDEPTSGLDPQAAREVKKLVSELKEEGTTVLLTTHRLEEIEELADRVVILKGRLVAEGTVDALRERLYGKRVLVRVETPDPVATLGAVDGVRKVTLEADGRAALALDDGLAIPALVRALVAAGLDVLEVTPDDQSLEQVYLDLLQRTEKEAAS